MGCLPRGWFGGSVRSLYLAILVLLLLELAEPEESCHFPQFLQSAAIDGTKRTWSTKKWWLNLRHEPRWVEKREIYVKNGMIWRHRDQQKSCERSPRRVYKSSFGLCSETQFVYNRTCITEEGFNTHRVIQYNADGTHRFTCMKFVKRSNNVVQVYEGPLSDTNDPELCYPERLELEKWPWIAPWNKVSTFCPVSGGFSFRTIRRLTNEDLCEDEWRRSSLEIECLRGDGMMFMAPKGSNCNPFLKEGDDKKLICWAGWESEDFIFMIASEEGRQPSYCLRFPRIQKGEFSVLVYFSVICPSEPDGKPPHGIEYYELRMHRKDPLSCRDDDSEKCEELTSSPEACTKDNAIFRHCAKTCGQCTTMVMENIRKRRCALDPNLSGEWVLYDSVGSHNVIIDKQVVTMSQLAAFHCLSSEKYEQNSWYKTSSVFENGCSPRYTCLEMIRRNNNILQYRIGPSHRDERKMEELCVFKDDPPPLKDSIRSLHLKNLILARRLWPSHCGLDGVIPFNGTINGRHCQGTVSDWDETTCNPRGKLVLHSETCKQLILSFDFRCLGVIRDETIPLRQLLLTRSLDGHQSFNCWVITSYIDQAEWPRRMMYQLPNTQCSLLMEIKRSDYTSSQIHIYLDDDAKHKNCKPSRMNHHHVVHKEVSKSTDAAYIIPNQRNAHEGETKIRNLKPEDTRVETHTNQPFKSVHGGGSCLWAYEQYYFRYTLILMSIMMYVVTSGRF